MKITRQMCCQLVSISALQAAMPDVLSPFEAETVQTAKDRALGLKRDAETTAEEWHVVETAHEVLRKALSERGTHFAADTA
ncbi:hypothetical protein MMA231_00947 [Asticcacaulis sp. MM231]|uniref:hypothetical protein n=1 Tax=Asticcacaulis sp. MM231 TaxID=3157666 RepID=UPI0032D59D4A